MNSRSLLEDSSELSNYETVGTITIYTFLSILIIQLILIFLSSNRGNCSYAVWHNISYLTFVHWVPLINLNQNSTLESFFSKLALIFKPFELPTFCPDDPISNSSYNQIKINSSGFINNSKEIFLIYLFILACCIVILLLEKYIKGKPILEQMKQEIKWNVIVRLHIVVFLDFITYSAINMNFYTGDGACSSPNLIFSLFFIISGVVWIMFIPIAIKQKTDLMVEMHPSIAFRSISTLIEEFKEIYDNVKYQYYTLFLVYRYSLGLCLIFLHHSPAVQILMISGFQIIMSKCYLVTYVLLARPYKHLFEAVTVLLTDFLSLILIIVVGIRSMNGISEDFKKQSTIGCIVIIWATEAVICVRFTLRLVYLQSPASPVQPVQEVVAIPNTTGPAEVVHDLKSSRSNKYSENSHEAIHDVTEINEKIESYYPNEPYRYTEQLNRSERMSRLGQLNSVASRNTENMPRVNLFNAAENSAYNTKNIIDSAYQTFNTPVVQDPRRYLENDEEQQRIRGFLAQLKENGIRVGNKGLN